MAERDSQKHPAWFGGVLLGNNGGAAVSVCGLCEDVENVLQICRRAQSQVQSVLSVPPLIQLNQSVIVCCRVSLPRMNTF